MALGLFVAWMLVLGGGACGNDDRGVNCTAPVAGLGPEWKVGNSVAGISSDGSVLTGYCRATRDNGNEDWDVRGAAYRWTASGGSKSIERFRPVGISADGSTIIGVSALDGSNVTFAARWTLTTGVAPLAIFRGDEASQPTVVSADGSVVVGVSTTQDIFSVTEIATMVASRPFRWTSAVGVEELGPMPP